MAYTDVGRGTPLLFIHGYPLNRHLWEPQVEGLSQEARILAPDLRGHGESQVIPGHYSMEMFADDLNAFLDALSITQPVVVCGLSMGGYVALAFLRKYTTRMAGLILTATRATADSPEARIGRDQAVAMAKEKGVSAIAETMLPKMLSPKTYERKPELVDRVRAIMNHTSLEGVLGDLNGLKQRIDSTPTLSHIKLPTLILAGADDQIIPLKEAQSMQASIPGARLVVIPDTGHLLNLEDPAAFNLAISDFLSRTSQDSRSLKSPSD
jgi:pimeloyl-ACP methyl ester carboxylesterase